MEEKAPSSSRELQCVGQLEIVSPKPVGFLCGSIPVPTDKAFHEFNGSSLLPSPQTVRAPRYRLIPTETNLNKLPLLSSIPEKVLPLMAANPMKGGELPWEHGTASSNLTRKGEALAVTGLVEYEDEIDVIAPADILKQIFKIPYSKARLSVAVHRVGQTLVLNTGPDIEEGEKLIRRHSNQSKCAEQSLLLNFAMHSVRMEACDCPPAHFSSSSGQSDSSILSGQFKSAGGSVESSSHQALGNSSCGQTDHIAEKGGLRDSQDFPHTDQDNILRGKRRNKRNKSREAVKKVSQVKEKSRCSVQQSERYRRVNSDGFLRVLFWQFHKFRMLLGSDLLIFSNEKYVAVSLHLWDISRQVTPLTWLEAWLDNVMANVPELAICYHQDGVVQGYELLKTDDIFLLKGISEDGTPAFNPHVVQQNGLSVLRFLEENCKQDPGAYWLYKSAGEDVIQLFDLTAIPKNQSSTECDGSSGPVPSLVHRGRSDSVLSLGTLLYRVAHRLSLSMSPKCKARCARFFKKCLDFLGEPDHLVVRASAHEQFARLLLTYDELDLAVEALPVVSEVTVADADEESFEISTGLTLLSVGSACSSDSEAESEDAEPMDNSGHENAATVTLNKDISSSGTLFVSGERDIVDPANLNSGQESLGVYNSPNSPINVVQTVLDPISSKLAAVHHVSQAIKSLRWKRQMQKSNSELNHGGNDELPPLKDFSVCACGDAECIEVCDIREWLPTSKLDDKLWKLVLLLGESYLALGQAYKDEGELHQTLKVVELACLVYGSMPQHIEDTIFISSIICSQSTQLEIDDRTEKSDYVVDDDFLMPRGLSPKYLFWAKAWTLVGDVFVEFYLIKGKEIMAQAENKRYGNELKMPSEVLKEVERLKKKLGQFSHNCNSCSLVNCSCQSDRASSGNSASSSARDTRSFGHSRKQNKKAHPRSNQNTQSSLKEIAHQKGVSDGITHADASEQMMGRTNQKVPESTTEKNNEELRTYNQSENRSEERAKVKNGGIFKYVRNPVIREANENLTIALSCYEEAIKALGGYPSTSAELQSVIKKKGWVCNEVGRSWLGRNEPDQAEIAFVDAIDSFMEVSDHTNIILINCNLGHGRRALAEEMVSKIESLKEHAVFHSTYKQALEAAKREYSKSLGYYGAARLELSAFDEVTDSSASSLRSEVCTQFAHTYLRLGMLLAREDTVAEVYESCILGDCMSPTVARAKRDGRKHEISANDAIREALSLYESLGELRKQEAAYAYYQLACYQKDCCLKFLEPDQKYNNLLKGENNVLQRVKQYASLAERNWQKSMEFYRAKTHPVMYLTILIERSALPLNLSGSLQSNTHLESALARMLEARHLSENTSISKDNPEVCSKYWSQLQMLLKRMLSVARSATTNKASINSQQTPAVKSGDVEKLRKLYMMSLKCTEFDQLHEMQSLWISNLRDSAIHHD